MYMVDKEELKSEILSKVRQLVKEKEENIVKVGSPKLINLVTKCEFNAYKEGAYRTACAIIEDIIEREYDE